MLRTTGNINELEANAEDSYLNVDSDGFEGDEELSTSSNLSKINCETPTPKRKQKNNITQFHKALLNSLSAPHEDNINSDPDKAFLFSLLPDYKKLNYDQKTDFRLHTLQFFKNISLQTKQSQPNVSKCNQTVTNLHQSTPSSSYSFQNQSNQSTVSYLPFSLGLPNNQPHVAPPTSLPLYESTFNPHYSQINNPYTSSYPITSEETERIKNYDQYK